MSVFFSDFIMCPLLFTVNDTLDDLFEDSGDEEESQDIVSQVLDEIGIEISGKVRVTRLNCTFFKTEVIK